MTNEQYIRKNALIYDRYKDSFDTIPDIAIRDFRREINEAYFNINKAIDVQFVDGQPYENVSELTMDIRANKRMRISHDYNESRLLPGMHNLYFRAVHDYLHYILQAPFDAMGELKVYHLQKKCHESVLSRKILFSEVVLQACYCEYYGKFAEFQKVVLYDGKI